jgi:Protein of unknown function (DUF3309)
MPIKGVLVLSILFCIMASLPAWPYSRRWTFYPSGSLSLLFFIYVALLLLRVI